ncbi:hypothetical protein EYF80_053055 [Liparis tanakae]|uniref:Uncharacterized protein n=1 Tax=Liparis tanakae TaxID=230148 RepID=A0A4Z2F6V2_9TELE|nr:hypothetical protein EYF80_053055 [Liparis tanakae]
MSVHLKDKMASATKEGTEGCVFAAWADAGPDSQPDSPSSSARVTTARRLASCRMKPPLSPADHRSASLSPEDSEASVHRPRLACHSPHFWSRTRSDWRDETRLRRDAVDRRHGREKNIFIRAGISSANGGEADPGSSSVVCVIDQRESVTIVSLANVGEFDGNAADSFSSRAT